MGIVLAVVIIILLLWVWGHGPRKTVAEAIVKSEDVGHVTVKTIKATPAVLKAGQVKVGKATATAVTTSTAVTKVTVNKSKKIVDASTDKGAVLADEAKHYVQGFVYDVRLERKRILKEKKDLARANRMHQANTTLLALPVESEVKQ